MIVCQINFIINCVKSNTLQGSILYTILPQNWRLYIFFVKLQSQYYQEEQQEQEQAGAKLCQARGKFKLYCFRRHGLAYFVCQVWFGRFGWFALVGLVWQIWFGLLYLRLSSYLILSSYLMFFLYGYPYILIFEVIFLLEVIFISKFIFIFEVVFIFEVILYLRAYCHTRLELGF